MPIGPTCCSPLSGCLLFLRYCRERWASWSERGNANISIRRGVSLRSPVSNRSKSVATRLRRIRTCMTCRSRSTPASESTAVHNIKYKPPAKVSLGACGLSSKKKKPPILFQRGPPAKTVPFSKTSKILTTGHTSTSELKASDAFSSNSSVLINTVSTTQSAEWIP